MPKFAANLHYLFAELPFLDRFEAAAAAGFRAVEFQVPYDYPGRELKARLDANGLEMVLFDAPMGDWNARRPRPRGRAWPGSGVSRQPRARAPTMRTRSTAISCM